MINKKNYTQSNKQTLQEVSGSKRLLTQPIQLAKTPMSPVTDMSEK